MLKKIECTGFKSLDNFELVFRPGLNVMVGPNGSGKTNIIAFLKFLSNLRHATLMEAISLAGGAGSIFRRLADGKVGSEIKFCVTGGSNRLEGPKEKEICLSYEYSAKIILSTEENTVGFASQRFRTWSSREGTLFEEDDRKLDLDVETSIALNGEVETRVHAFDSEAARFAKNKTIEEVSDQISELSKQYAKSICLLDFIDRFTMRGFLLYRDLLGTRSYNISPHQVRAPEDIASAPSIQADGRGLAATLYALQSASHFTARRHFGFGFVREFENPKKILREVIAYGRLVNENILGIRADSDPIESKLKIFVDVLYEDGKLSLPFSLMSDGTAKWFTLVAAVMTNESLFAIEELENFLHPAMQAEIIRIVRSQYADDTVERFALLTTHSETILNNCSPDELIVVGMRNGRTFAHRPTNAEEVSEEIKNTGFGLGYYYLSGAME